jgi:glycine/D-amino acid oxidase-like deaminating enzyme
MTIRVRDAERGFKQSLWQATTSSEFHCPRVTDDQEADVVIIGAGFTGLSAALHLGELGKSVVVLEAEEIAWGAAGRNGGQVNPGWKILPSQIRALYGSERGHRILRLVDSTCDLVFDLIDRHAIDCAPRRTPYFRAAFGARGVREVKDWVREWGDYGSPVTLKDEPQTRDLTGSKFFHGGMEDARGGSLQPLAYARGLAQAAKRAGAKMFSNSRAKRVYRERGQWFVETQNGVKVSAQHLVLATNGYTDELWPGLRKQIVPVASLQAATEPLPNKVLQTLLPGGHHLSDTRRAMIYCRIDENNRFQIGGRGSPFTPTLQQGDTRNLQVQACKIFPQLKNFKWEFHWGGLVAMTSNHVPQLIELGDNAHAGLGYNGRGIAMATTMGKQIADLIAGEDVPMPREKLSPIAFHKFRNVGIAWHMITGSILDRFM